MTTKEQAKIIRRALQDASALKAGWPSKGCPYQRQDEADLWQEHFELAMKEGKK